MNLRLTSFALLAIGLTSVVPTYGALSLTSISYTQNFDGLASSGATNSWTNDSTLTGWYWQTGSANPTTYAANDGSSGTDGRYSYGTGTSPDRAMGHYDAKGTGAMGIVFKNDITGGVSINSIAVDYFGEQWRQTSNSNGDSLQFSYRISSTNITDLLSGSWTAVNSLDFSAPHGGSDAALDGNAAANRTQKNATITLTVPNGQYLALRWFDVDNNGNGKDAGLGIDNLSVTAAVPEPSAFLFGGLVAGVIGCAAGGKKLASKIRKRNAA